MGFLAVVEEGGPEGQKPHCFKRYGNVKRCQRDRRVGAERSGSVRQRTEKTLNDSNQSLDGLCYVYIQRIATLAWLPVLYWSVLSPRSHRCGV